MHLGLGLHRGLLYIANYCMHVVRKITRKKKISTICFFPHQPTIADVLFKISVWNGYQIQEKMSDSDVVVYWNDTTKPGKCLFKATVNAGVTTIAKDYISDVFTEVFGREITINPVKSTGVCVKKNKKNAKHDGVIEQCPLEPQEGYVYQKLINNVISNDIVEDIRIPVINYVIPLVYIKKRSIANRFKNDNCTSNAYKAENVLLDEEIHNVVHFCKKLQIDYCEIDAIRDYPTGDLYIVDVNHCPSGPPNHLPLSKSIYAIWQLARKFDTEYGKRFEKI